MINERGQKGLFSESTTYFLDYFTIRIPSLNNTRYLVYKYHEKYLWGFEASSNFWKNFQTVEELEKNLSFKENASIQEIDNIIYNNFIQFGDIQVLVENNEQESRFQLETSGFLFSQKIKRVPTLNDPMDNKHLAPQESCSIM